MVRSLGFSLLVLVLSTSCLEAYKLTDWSCGPVFVDCGTCAPPTTCQCVEPIPCLKECKCVLLPPPPPPFPSKPTPPVEKSPPPPTIPKPAPPVEKSPPPPLTPKPTPPIENCPPPSPKPTPPVKKSLPPSVSKPNPPVEKCPPPPSTTKPTPPVEKSPPPPSVPKPTPPVAKPSPPPVVKPNPPSPKKPQPPSPSTPKPPAQRGHHPKCPNPLDYCRASEGDFYLVKQRKKCWCSLQHCEGCFQQIWTAVIHDFTNVSKECCKAFLKVDRNCHKLMFESFGYKWFVYRLEQHCCQFY